MYLRSKCDNCHTCVDSKILEFNTLKEFVKPVGIIDEQLMVKDDKYLYELYSSFEQELSELVISTIKPTSNSIRMQLPLLPMYKLKTKDKLIQKAKTYLLFS